MSHNKKRSRLLGRTVYVKCPQPIVQGSGAEPEPLSKLAQASLLALTLIGSRNPTIYSDQLQLIGSQFITVRYGSKLEPLPRDICGSTAMIQSQIKRFPTVDFFYNGLYRFHRAFLKKQQGIVTNTDFNISILH